MEEIYSPEVKVAKLTRIQVDHGQVAVVVDQLHLSIIKTHRKIHHQNK